MNNINIKNILIDILSIIDSYHDFYKSKRINNINKIYINKLFENNSFIEYLFVKSNNYPDDYIVFIKELFNVDNNNNLKSIIVRDNKKINNENNIFNVNKDKFKNQFLKKLLIKNDNLYFSQCEMLRVIDDIILENFKLIFVKKDKLILLNNFNKKNNKESQSLVNILLSNITKIRLPLYYLINNIFKLGIDKFELTNDDIQTYLKIKENNIQKRKKIDDLINKFETGKSNISIYSYTNLLSNSLKKNIIYNQSSIINDVQYKTFHTVDNFKLQDTNEQGYKIYSDFERHYFSKYLKYKQKYIKLKNIYK